LANPGFGERAIERREVVERLLAGTPAELFEGRRVLVLTPDPTRTCPLPMLVRAVREAFGARAAALNFMVATGTHAPLSEPEILRLYGIAEADRPDFGTSRFLCHRFDQKDSLARVGWLEEDLVARLSEGRLRERVPVDLNRAVLDHDLVLVLGPVFPHEVVGFSGGAKYLFPGISGGELIHFFHWLGAVITCARIIGQKDTPVRQVIHAALARVPRKVHCAALVVDHDAALRGLFVGDPVEAWSRAADLSLALHVRTLARPFHTVLGSAAARYDELWTAGKVMYKLEQVVADGGELIIHAPHVDRISRTFGALIERVGYHVRDYFLAQPERFLDVPRGVLAHSTHVRGTGTYEDGVERPRIRVTLATRIPPEICARVCLGYADPASIELARYQGREAEGVLFVPDAGEVLYRLETPLGS
jgi:nickel-dependent lactate racemase